MTEILQDSLPMKDVPLVLADCQKATPFFWDKSNICAHVVSEYTRSPALRLFDPSTTRTDKVLHAVDVND